MPRLLPVVLLDDDPDEHYLFQADLKDSGLDFHFAPFTRPAEALSYLTDVREHPVLVLTDLGLGSGDAFAFISEAVAALLRGAVGVYSGVHNPELDKKCQAAGASFYLVKPICAAKLEEVVAAIPGVTLLATADGRRCFVVG